MKWRNEEKGTEGERGDRRRERKINSEDIAGGFPYYILHRRRL